MSVRGGDIRQFKVNGRELDVAGDTSLNLILPGFNNTNTITGNGNVATIQKRKLSGFSDMIVSINDSNDDYEFLQEVWDTGEEVPIVLTLATGSTYSGSLAGEGELQLESSTGQVTLGMLGAKFEKI